MVQICLDLHKIPTPCEKVYRVNLAQGVRRITTTAALRSTYRRHEMPPVRGAVHFFRSVHSQSRKQKRKPMPIFGIGSDIISKHGRNGDGAGFACFPFTDRDLLPYRLPHAEIHDVIKPKTCFEKQICYKCISTTQAAANLFKVARRYILVFRLVNLPNICSCILPKKSGLVKCPFCGIF